MAWCSALSVYLGEVDKLSVIVSSRKLKEWDLNRASWFCFRDQNSNVHSSLALFMSWLYFCQETKALKCIPSEVMQNFIMSILAAFYFPYMRLYVTVEWQVVSVLQYNQSSVIYNDQIEPGQLYSHMTASYHWTLALFYGYLHKGWLEVT